MMQHEGSSSEAGVIPPHVFPASDESIQGNPRIREAANEMIRWLVDASVRNVNPASKGYGSFYHGVHAQTQERQGQYTEITGYGVSILSHLYRWRKEERFLVAARQAARFLMSIQSDDGAFPVCPDPEKGPEGNERFTFDTSMCTMGLMDLYAIDPNEAILHSAQRAARWLLSMQREDGSFYARSLPGENPIPTGNFFGDGSCIHVKNAMALYKVADIDGDVSMIEGGQKACEYAISLQSDDGFFWAMPSRDFVFSHAHCYACEGLFSSYGYSQDERFRQAALKGIDWLRRVQNEDGSINQVYQDQRGFKHRLRIGLHAFRAADATSQSARLFKLAGPEYQPDYDRAVDYVLNNLQTDQGGLVYVRGRFKTNEMQYAWPTMFAIEALEFDHIPASPKDLF